MKALLKFFAYLIMMLALIIFFLPKVNLYYEAEKFLKAQKVTISEEKVLDRGISLQLEDGSIYYDKLNLASIGLIHFSPWMVYNSLEFNEIRVNEGLADFLPETIDHITIRHVVYNPTKVSLRGESAEDYFYGEVDLLKRVLQLHLRLDSGSERKYQNILKKLSKEEGGYLYEYQF